MVNAMKLLKRHKETLTKQQYRTFKGQIIHGDIEGFKKGLYRLSVSNSK